MPRGAGCPLSGWAWGQHLGQHRGCWGCRLLPMGVWGGAHLPEASRPCSAVGLCPSPALRWGCHPMPPPTTTGQLAAHTGHIPRHRGNGATPLGGSPGCPATSEPRLGSLVMALGLILAWRWPHRSHIPGWVWPRWVEAFVPIYRGPSGNVQGHVIHPGAGQPVDQGPPNLVPAGTGPAPFHTLPEPQTPTYPGERLRQAGWPSFLNPARASSIQRRCL